MIAIDKYVLLGILSDNANTDEATNSNDESGRYRMPILRQWESEDAPTFEGEQLVRVGDVWMTRDSAEAVTEQAA